MIKVEGALKIVLENIKPLRAQKIEIRKALDRVLAEDIYSEVNLPPFDNSAMDGYALKASDTEGASKDSPRVLEAIEDLRAGYVSCREIKRGQAIGIMTGAPIPKGADSVVMVENTQREQRAKSKEQRVKVFREVKSGENIRRAGEDVKKDELILQKGRLIGPAEIGMLAALGVKKVMIARPPKVAILATGDEIVDVGEDLAPGKIRNSNSYSLCAQVLRYGGQPQDLGIARDKVGQTEEKIKRGLDSDIILVSGGISVGDYDFVKDALMRLGMEMKFWKVAMRPGKPLVFGILEERLVFGLPGNPVSGMVSFEVFLRPAILKMLGQDQEDKKEVVAVLEEDIKKKKGIKYFLRAQTEWKGCEYRTKTIGPQGSGILKSMVLANSLIVLPEEEEFIEKGTRVTVRFLD